MNGAQLRHHLRRGGLIAYPTESCYGLGCDPRNAQAVQRLLRLKQRHPAKGLILIGASFAQLRPYLARLSASQRQTLQRTWPGAHTWLVPAARHCPVFLRGNHPTIAVRVPAHAGARALCRMAGVALVSTSANLSGGKPARTAAECRRWFGARVKVIAGRIGTRRQPSRIQDLVSGQILR